MKRRDLMKRLAKIAKSEGANLELREGGNHTVVRIGDRVESVPRHNEIAELLAQKIIRKMEGNR